MPIPRQLVVFLRSLLALVLAIAAIPAVNLAGAWLSSHAFGLPSGGTPRLAVDLFWVFMAGVSGAWLMVKVAAVAKSAHAWALFAIYLAAGLHGAITIWDEFPRWFTVGFIMLLPLQVWLGWWLGWGRLNAGGPPCPLPSFRQPSRCQLERSGRSDSSPHSPLRSE